MKRDFLKEIDYRREERLRTAQERQAQATQRRREQSEALNCGGVPHRSSKGVESRLRGQAQILNSEHLANEQFDKLRGWRPELER